MHSIVRLGSVSFTYLTVTDCRVSDDTFAAVRTIRPLSPDIFECHQRSTYTLPLLVYCTYTHFSSLGHCTMYYLSGSV
jgi:hypothetical protein